MTGPSAGLMRFLSRFKALLRPDNALVADEVYEKSRRASLAFAGLGVLVNAVWWYLDVGVTLAEEVLHAGCTVMCCVAAVAVTRPVTARSRLVFNTAVVLALLFEIEARFHSPDTPFWAPSVWSVFPAVMVLFAFLFLGPPLYYAAVAAVLLLFYEARSYSQLRAPGADEHAIVDVQFFTFVLIILYVTINLWWFYVRYRGAAQEREIQALHEVALREANLRAETEKRLLLSRERNRVSADFHDNLGGSLTDLQIFLKRHRGNGAAAKDWDAVDGMVQSVVESFKNALHDHRAAESLNSNFVLAVKSLFVRRYVNSGRQFRFETDDRARSSVACLTDTDRQCLFNLLQEVLNNDLKYGAGEPQWSLLMEGENLELAFRTETTAPDGAGSGFGRTILLERCKELGAAMKTSADDGRLEIRVIIPAERIC